MPPKKGVGGNYLARIMALLDLAAKQEAGARAETLGLGLAKAQEEEALLQLADKRRAAKKIEQQQREQREISAAAATARTAEQLYGAMQEIEGTQLHARMQEIIECTTLTDMWQLGGHGN